MNLLIVDDDNLIRKSLSMMLSKEADINVMGNATNGAEAVEMCKAQQPDVILMDIRMPKLDGIGATRLIKKEHPQIKIMMLTTFDDKPNIQQAISAGADGYLLKTDEISDVAGKLKALAGGVGVLDTEVLKKLTSSENEMMEKLTQREQDIVRLVAQGMTNKEIGTHLFLSEGTVRNNIATVLEKLDLKNRTQLSAAYYGKV